MSGVIEMDSPRLQRMTLFSRVSADQSMRLLRNECGRTIWAAYSRFCTDACHCRAGGIASSQFDG